MLKRRDALFTGAGLLGASMLPHIARAQDYPDRPITVAMMAPAGGATDIGTRPITSMLKESLNAPAIALQDMSGAGGIQGLDYVMAQPTDGYTWAGMNDVIESFPSLGRIDYDWRAFDFWMSAGTACGICVPASSKIETFDQFMNEMTDKPGQYSVSSTPSGSLWSNVAVYLRSKSGVDFKLANYKGGGPSVRAVLSGETDFGCMGVTPMVNFIQAGQLRCLAATVPEEWETAGTVIPSMAQWIKDPLFVKTLPWTNIHGIALKKGAPEEVKDKITAGFNEAMESSEILKVYADNAFFPFQVTPPEANELMGARTALQAYIVEAVLGNAVKTRDELGIEKIEDSV